MKLKENCLKSKGRCMLSSWSELLIRRVVRPCQKSKVFIAFLEQTHLEGKWDDGTRLRQTFLVLHSVVRMKSDRNSCETNLKSELEREAQNQPSFSPSHGWSMKSWCGCECQVGLGKLPVSKRWDAASRNPTSERRGGRGLPKLFNYPRKSEEACWPLQSLQPK